MNKIDENCAFVDELLVMQCDKHASVRVVTQSSLLMLHCILAFQDWSCYIQQNSRALSESWIDCFMMGSTLLLDLIPSFQVASVYPRKWMSFALCSSLHDDWFDWESTDTCILLNTSSLVLMFSTQAMLLLWSMIAILSANITPIGQVWSVCLMQCHPCHCTVSFSCWTANSDWFITNCWNCF